jgi:carboxylate-amine ligase
LPKDFSDRYSYELILSEIEINTSVSKTVDDAIKEIIFLRNYTKKIGEKYNYQIGISGTHPTAICKEQLFVDNKSYNWVANQLHYYAKRNVTFSNHVHIAVDGKECAIHVANAMRRWIAPMLALSTNSPFFEGEKTGLRSSRTFQFSSFPRTNIPNYFKNFSQYEKVLNQYLKTKSIEKPRHIWWKIRPHIDYGTIEFRVCDAQRSVANIRMLAGLSQALVYRACAEYHSGKLHDEFNMDYLSDSLWKASRFPIDVEIIDPLTEDVSTLKSQIDLMVEYSSDALKEFNNYDIVDSINKIILYGTEADDQLKVFSDLGFEELKMYLINNVDYQN